MAENRREKELKRLQGQELLWYGIAPLVLTGQLHAGNILRCRPRRKAEALISDLQEEPRTGSLWEGFPRRSNESLSP